MRQSAIGERRPCFGAVPLTHLGTTDHCRLAHSAITPQWPATPRSQKLRSCVEGTALPKIQQRERSSSRTCARRPSVSLRRRAGNDMQYNVVSTRQSAARRDPMQSKKSPTPKQATDSSKDSRLTKASRRKFLATGAAAAALSAVQTTPRQ